MPGLVVSLRILGLPFISRMGFMFTETRQSGSLKLTTVRKATEIRAEVKVIKRRERVLGNWGIRKYFLDFEEKNRYSIVSNGCC